MVSFQTLALRALAAATVGLHHQLLPQSLSFRDAVLCTVGLWLEHTFLELAILSSFSHT